MLTYNTQQEKLKLPGYGRNIQQMVDHCLTLDDRDERNRCANTIITSMASLFPELKQPENRHKLWDHLAIMSGFKLDIDWPYPVVQPEELATQPEPLPYHQHELRFRHYGAIVPAMIQRIVEMEGGPEKDEAIFLLANHMKKQLLAISPDGVEDVRVFRDIYEYSKGQIHLNPDDCRLLDFKVVAPASSKKKKKKAVSLL